MITYPLSLPRPMQDIAEMTLTERSITLLSSSPFTFEQQTYSIPGQRWECSVQLNPLVRAVAEEWISFLLSLRGGYGTFLMGDPNATSPRGSAGGTPIVAVGSQTGSVLTIASAASSQSGWMRAGDYLSVGGRMYKNLKDVGTALDGSVSLDLWPMLRSPPSSGSAIAVNSVMCTWRLLEDTVSRQITVPGIYHISFSAVEAIP